MNYIGRARLYKQTGQLEKARADFNSAVENDPNSTSYYFRGTFLASMGENESAEADLTTSIRKDRGFHGHYLSRAKVRAAMGNYPGAIEDLQKHQSRAYTHEAQLLLAFYYLQNDQKNLGLDALQQVEDAPGYESRCASLKLLLKES
jgi:tetratricopeptide (TPR) repeat protein